MGNLENEIIVFDTETTGLFKYGERIPQVLQLSILNGNGETLFNEYLKPRGIKSWHEAEKIHHITFDMVKDKHTFKYYQKQVQQIFDNAKTIIGYNVQFDIMQIARYINIDTEKKNIIDVMPMFSDAYNDLHPYYGTPKWQKLTTATAYYNYNWDAVGKPHGALADAHATLYVYNQLKNETNKILFENVPKLYNDVLDQCKNQISNNIAIGWKTLFVKTQSHRNDAQWRVCGYENFKPIYYTIEHPTIRFYKMMCDALQPIITDAPPFIKYIYNNMQWLYNGVANANEMV